MKQKNNIVRYWPKSFSSFYRAHIDVTDNERDQIKFILYNLKQNDEMITTFGQKNILEFPNMLSLRKKIIHTLDELGLQLTNSWAQLYLKGHKHEVHNHALCNYSGILYVDSKSNDGTSFFDISGYKHEEKFEPNKLIVFPSWVLHKVDIQEENNERIVVAFNSIIDDKR